MAIAISKTVVAVEMSIPECSVIIGALDYYHTMYEGLGADEQKMVSSLIDLLGTMLTA